MSMSIDGFVDYYYVINIARLTRMVPESGHGCRCPMGISVSQLYGDPSISPGVAKENRLSALLDPISASPGALERACPHS